MADVETLKSLHEHVFAASGPDDALDNAIYNALDLDFCQTSLTHSLDAVIGLVHRRLPWWVWKVEFDPCRLEGPYMASLDHLYIDKLGSEGFGKTAPLAVLSALLWALRAQEEAKEAGR